MVKILSPWTDSFVFIWMEMIWSRYVGHFKLQVYVFFIYIRRVFCSLIHISLASNAILRRLFEACRLEVH